MSLTRAERNKLIRLGSYTKIFCNICGLDLTHNENITMHYRNGDVKHKTFFNTIARPNSRVKLS